MHEKKNPNRPLIVYYIIALVVVMLLNALLFPQIERYSVKQVDYSEFLSMLEDGKVKSVEIDDTQIAFTPVEQIQDGKATYYTTNRVTADDKLVERLLAAGVEFGQVVPEEMSPIISFLVSWVLPLVIFYGLGSFMFRKMSQRMGGNTMSFGKSNAKIYVEAQTGKTFDDVAGEDEAKDALKEIVDFLHDPQKYRDIGAKLPKGALLVGPPGTGKTLLAKAVAGEAGVPFMSISGSDFVEMYVGVGASRVRDLFDTARKSPAAIIFIDEIDAVGRHRGAGLGGGHDEREQTLNQLLVEMDGFGSHDGIIVMAATNRPDILDPALLRPGRFDRQVTVNYPDIKGREAILQVHARNKPLEAGVDFHKIAQSTVGFTGADLANLLNEAALHAAKKGKSLIGMDDIEESYMKVLLGPQKKSRVRNDKDNKLVAYHEAGHAVVTYYCKHTDPVKHITIIPAGRAGGVTIRVPLEDQLGSTKGEMIDDIRISLGGRIAEELILDDISTGASSDIQKATQVARNMVTRYGMSDRLGPILYGSEHTSDEVFLGRDFSSGKDYSEETAAAIDEEVHAIIEQAYADAKKMLQDHIDRLHFVAQYLLKHESMDGDQFAAAMKEDATVEKLEAIAAQKAEASRLDNEKAAEAAKKAEENGENRGNNPDGSNGSDQPGNAPDGRSEKSDGSQNTAQ